MESEAATSPPKDDWKTIWDGLLEAGERLFTADANFRRCGERASSLDKTHPPSEQRHVNLAVFKARLEQEKARYKKMIADYKLVLLLASESEKVVWENNIKEYEELLESLEKSEDSKIEEHEKELLKRFPDPFVRQFKSMSWAEISQEMHEYKFTHLHLAEDSTSTMNALGSLCNGEGTWPLLTNGRIDMQFAPFEMFSPQTKISCDGNKDGDYSPTKLCSLRPAAERLKTELEKKNSTCTAHVLLAGPGLGKTSALADLGRQSWIIYMRATRPSDYGHFWEPTPRNCDSSFLRLNNELEKDRFEAKAKEELYADWSMVVHRFTAEMVARVLHLVRLHRHCSESNRTLTPWDFTFQQIKGGQTFPSNMSRILKSVDEQSLMKILEEAMAELKPIMGDRKLIVAIDNVSGAREMLTGWFQRPVDSQQAASDAQTDCSLSILAPLCEVVSKLSELTGWHLVLAGDEPSNQFIRGLKVDLGKIELKTVIANASDFPLASAEQVIAILEQLNISEELKDALKGLVTDESREGLSQPTLVQGDSLVRDIVQLLKDYVVGARFGILCGAIEQISKFVGKGIRDEILMCALQQSLEDHRRSLIRALSSRLDCKSHANYLGSRELEHVYLRNMVQISVAVGLTNGKVRFVKNPDLPSLGSDLVRLGLAPFPLTSPCDTNIECDDPPIEYIVSERFAIEALNKFLAN